MLLPLDDHLLPLPSAHTVKIPYPNSNENTDLWIHTMVHMNKTTNWQSIHKITLDLCQKTMNAAPHHPGKSKLSNNQIIHQDEVQWNTCCRVGSCMGTWTVKILTSLNCIHPVKSIARKAAVLSIIFSENSAIKNYLWILCIWNFT